MQNLEKKDLFFILQDKFIEHFEPSIEWKKNIIELFKLFCILIEDEKIFVNENSIYSILDLTLLKKHIEEFPLSTKSKNINTYIDSISENIKNNNQKIELLNELIYETHGFSLMKINHFLSNNIDQINLYLKNKVLKKELENNLALSQNETKIII